MRTLFITSTSLGDAVISTGLLDHLLRAHPDARVTVACGHAVTGLFEAMPRLDAIIAIRKRKLDLHWAILWSRIAFTIWDLVIDLRGSGISYMVLARRRIIKGRNSGRRKYQELGDLLGLDPAPLPVVWTAAGDRRRAAELLPAERPLIGIGPTTAWPAKMWPADHFAGLFRELASGPLAGAVPVIFAGPGATERALAQPLVDTLPEAINLTGKLTLAEVAACMQRCALFIGNDSGLTHLAAASGIPTLGLCATETSERAAQMAPAGRYAEFILVTGRMSGLSVATAREAAENLLGRAAAS